MGWQEAVPSLLGRVPSWLSMLTLLSPQSLVSLCHCDGQVVQTLSCKWYIRSLLPFPDEEPVPVNGD